MSSTYTYWDGDGPTIPPRFRNWDGADICHERQGHRVAFPDDLRDAFVQWLEQEHGHGVLGEPRDWD